MEDIYLSISRFIGIECGVRQIAPESIGKVYLPGIADNLLQVRRIDNFGNTCNSTHIKGILVGYNHNGQRNILTQIRRKYHSVSHWPQRPETL